MAWAGEGWGLLIGPRPQGVLVNDQLAEASVLIWSDVVLQALRNAPHRLASVAKIRQHEPSAYVEVGVFLHLDYTSVSHDHLEGEGGKVETCC